MGEAALAGVMRRSEQSEQMDSSVSTAAPFSAHSFAQLAPRRSTETMSPPRRPDTPQLSLHEFRRFQASPLLSASPGLHSRRVRRVAATANLTAGSPVRTSFAAAMALGSSAQTGLIHSTAPFDSLSPLLSPHPPLKTPQQQPRPATASPSLSSTVDTLQSTPTHAPVPRGDHHLCHHHSLQQFQLVEPLRTKRKFPALRPAKRLPRPAGGSGGSGSSAGELYSVYAAVFDPSEQDCHTGSAHLTHPDHPPPLDFSAVGLPQQIRQPTGSRNQDLCERLHAACTDTTADSSGYQERDLAATSAFSLSRFEFPVPPGRDNWSTIDHLADFSTPSSPATLHYYGTSFEVVNPHASLLLGTHTIETPAEIDGLLDDYFQQESEEENMPARQLRSEASELSLGAASDSSRHTRRLYDDATSARRNILHVNDDLPAPPPAIINDSPLAYKSSSSLSLNIPQALTTPSTPFPSQFPRSSPHVDVPSVDSVINFVKDEVERYESLELAKRDAPLSNPAPSVTHPTSILKKASGIKRSLSSKAKKSRRRSDPFNLTLSFSGDVSVPVPPVDNSAEQRIECEPVLESKGGEAPSQLSEQGYTTHTNSDEHNTDPIVREILNGYDYTREQARTDGNEVFIRSPSLEKGADLEQERHDSEVQSVIPSRPPPLNPFADGTYPALKEVSPLTLCFPTPPAPVYGVPRYHYWERSSELPTSEQTYGETNQLLLVTPDATSVGHKSTNKTIHVEGISEKASGKRPSYHSHSYNREPALPSPSLEQARAHIDDAEPMPSDLGLAPGSDFYNMSPEAYRRQLRSSSILLDDYESGWETQCTGSYVDPHRERERASDESFANRNSCGGSSIYPEDFSSYSVEPLAPKKLPTSSDCPVDAAKNARKAAKKMVALLEDKILSEEIDHRLCGGPAPDKEQRKSDRTELERLRREYPSRFSLIAEEYRQKVKHRTSLIKSGSLQKLQHTFNKGKGKGKGKVPYDPEQTFNKAVDIGLGTRGKVHDPAADCRRLLNSSPSPALMDGELQWSDSFGTMVTTRDDSPFAWPKDTHGTVPEFWSPFMGDATSRVLDSQNLESPFHPVNNGVTRPPTKNSRGTRAAITGQKGLHDLTLKPQKRARLPRDEGTYELQVLQPPQPLQTRQASPARRSLRDEKLIQRSASWTMEPNLTAAGALGRYAQQPEVLARGLIMPRLRSADCHVNPDDPMGDQGKAASVQAAQECIFFPWQGLFILCGGGDRIVRRKTAGVIRKMLPKQKALAAVYTIVGFAIWAAVATLLWYFITKILDTHSSADSSPFADVSDNMPS